MTKNRLDYIHRAMLRPGRIDALIRLGQMDAVTVVQMVRAYSIGMLEGNLDQDELYEAAKDYPPAFIAYAVHRSKAYAISQNGHNDVNVMISSSNIADALRELRPQFELMNSAQTQDKPELTMALSALVDGVVEPLKKDVQSIKSYIVGN